MVLIFVNLLESINDLQYLLFRSSILFEAII